MIDEQTPALEAGDEDVAEAVIETTEDTTDEPEAVETEGQDNDPPAEGDAPEEKASKSKVRRERRRAEMDQQRQAAEEAERGLSEANTKLQRLEQAVQHMQPPKESDFEDYQQFLAADTAFRSIQILDNRAVNESKTEADERQRQYDQLQQHNQTAARNMFEESCVEARDRYPDFDAVARADFPVNKTMADILVGLDSGPDVLYQLGKNPAKAAKIAAMPPVQAALEIGRIEAGLKQPKPITKSNAPSPITPVRGAGSPTKDPSKMSHNEYVKWRAAGGTF